MSKHAHTMNDEAIEFRADCVGAHHGQLDINLIALIDGEPCGQIQFSEYEKKPSVKWIEVAEDRQREGIGRAMVLELQSRYPNTELDFGMMTDDGIALLESIPSIEVDPSPERTKLESQLLSLRSTEARCQAACDRFEDLSDDVRASKTTQLEFSRVLTTWQSVQNEIDDIKTSLSAFAPPQKILIAPETSCAAAPSM